MLIKNFISSPLPIPHYLFPITHYPLPITHYPLPITHYPLPVLYNGTKNPYNLNWIEQINIQGS
ncbi:hypothetical protein [Planktothrix agardhii]|uniref:hypothetical protein n=1 Tax=Planktothrix agardhii TaxID=1160 RepID=UPI0020A71D27|nr:hypothetical protein [Planktothrix agardhii]